jgi:hypothetical protein
MQLLGIAHKKRFGNVRDAFVRSAKYRGKG